jgi:hypothetical protein
VSKYQGVEPFHLYLKGIFQQNKNWGSNDRKNYRRICYTYWRYFDLLESLPTEEIQRMAGKNDDDEETRPKKRIAVEKDQSKEAAARIHRNANGESTIGDQETTEDKEKRKDTEVETGDEAEIVSDQSEVSRVRLTAEISEAA